MALNTELPKAALIRHRPDEEPLEAIRAHVKLWAQWRKNDDLPDMGYPHQSAEQVGIGLGPTALPGWVIEMTMDSLIMVDMRTELRRAVLAVNGIPLRHSEAEAAGVRTNQLHFKSALNKYLWPSDMDRTAGAAGFKKRTLYSQYTRALEWLDGRCTPQKSRV